MCFGELVVQSERLRAGGQDRLDPRLHMIVEEKERIAIGDAGVGAGIDADPVPPPWRTSAAPIVVTISSAGAKLPASQIIGVGLDIIGRRLRDRLLLLRQQLDLELLDDGVR